MGVSIRRGQIIDQFTIKELLPEGSGGMATVVRAIDRTGNVVALKISHAIKGDIFSDALITEAEILQRLNHPGIVKIRPIRTDIGKIRYMERATELEGAPWFFVMEFLEGGSLRDFLNKVTLLSAGETCFIAMEIVKALNYIHSLDYVHNDIKIDNILFRKTIENGKIFEPVLIDFGIASKASHVQQDAGSLQWMSPERLQEVRHEIAPEVKLDPTKVDVYAIGVLVYRMLTNKMPFTGLNEQRITEAIMHRMPEHIKTLNSQVPTALDELVLECIAKNPENRPTTQQLIKEFANYSTDKILTVTKNNNKFGK